MYDLSCVLVSISFKSDEIGQQKEKRIIKREVPIIRVEPIYQKEFYAANQQGIRPSKKLVISNLNYDGEEELEYMGKTYKVIRTQNPKLDELEMICERKANK